MVLKGGFHKLSEKFLSETEEHLEKSETHDLASIKKFQKLRCGYLASTNNYQWQNIFEEWVIPMEMKQIKSQYYTFLRWYLPTILVNFYTALNLEILNVFLCMLKKIIIYTIIYLNLFFSAQMWSKHPSKWKSVRSWWLKLGNFQKTATTIKFAGWT